MLRYRGSRSWNIPSSGEAMKIEEYEPVINPTSSANEKSRSSTAPRIPEPTISSESTGSTAASDVFSVRISTWFIETLITSPYGARAAWKRAVFSRTLSNTTIVS